MQKKKPSIKGQAVEFGCQGASPGGGLGPGQGPCPWVCQSNLLKN